MHLFAERTRVRKGQCISAWSQNERSEALPGEGQEELGLEDSSDESEDECRANNVGNGDEDEWMEEKVDESRVGCVSPKELISFDVVASREPEAIRQLMVSRAELGLSILGSSEDAESVVPTSSSTLEILHIRDEPLTQSVHSEGNTSFSDDIPLSAFLSQNGMHLREVQRRTLHAGESSVRGASRALQKELQRLEFKVDYNGTRDKRAFGRKVFEEPVLRSMMDEA
ncbi:hypothetical protein Scep_004078 [Stephania cephalantha]|uniref:Uncharacterized protein n=1 Tax=Stephania cephalantha TaxID=152367 RepID=A0AAP0KTD4_9MAGN